MNKSPILWGAGLACALGGALAGNAVGSTPVTDRSTIAMFYQAHKAAFADRDERRALPNHYPLVTRNGVVEVAQLSDRGLFSQSRYRPTHAAVAYASADDRDPGPGLEEGYASSPAQASPIIEASAPAEPLSLAQGPSQIAGQARIIDVQAALAMR